MSNIKLKKLFSIKNNLCGDESLQNMTGCFVIS